MKYEESSLSTLAADEGKVTLHTAKEGKKSDFLPEGGLRLRPDREIPTARCNVPNDCKRENKLC